MGKMMKRARASVWVSSEDSDRTGVRVSEDNTMFQIRHSAWLAGEPQIVELCDEEQYTVASPFGNPNCFYGQYRGKGYRC